MTTAEVRQRILAANEAAAASLRERFRRDGTLVLNLISSPGSGKTSLLEAAVPRLGAALRIAALEGDVATENDARRLRARGIPAAQILTGGACHLDARQIEKALGQVEEDRLDVLFIENVGNLICPTSFDLGEDLKVALLSVTEGDDKPEKYPGIFSRAGATVLTKSDLLPHVRFDVHAVLDRIRVLNPEARVLLTSAVSGDGVEAFCDLVRQRLASKRAAVATA
jgi:hydrogenase nickel incorporation protein HypB